MYLNQGIIVIPWGVSPGVRECVSPPRYYSYTLGVSPGVRECVSPPRYYSYTLGVSPGVRECRVYLRQGIIVIPWGSVLE